MLIVLVIALVLVVLGALWIAARHIYRQSMKDSLARQRAEADAKRMEMAALDALTIPDILTLRAQGWDAPEPVMARLKADAQRLMTERAAKDLEDIRKRHAAGERLSQSELRTLTDARIKAGHSLPARFWDQTSITAGNPAGDFVHMSAGGFIRSADIMEEIFVSEHAQPVGFISRNGRRYYKRSDGSFTYAL